MKAKKSNRKSSDSSQQPQNSPIEHFNKVREALQKFEAIDNIFLRRIIQISPWVLLLYGLWHISDFMFFTGTITAAIAIFLFLGLMKLIPVTFRILWERNLLGAKSEDQRSMPLSPANTMANSESLENQYLKFIEEFDKLLNGRGQIITALVTGGLGGIWAIIFWTLYYSNTKMMGLYQAFIYVLSAYFKYGLSHFFLSPVFLVYFLAGCVLGIFIWRMLVTSYEIWKLEKLFDLTIQLGHPDHCGGLEPLGNLCLWNALIASVAGIYLGGWISILKSNIGTHYQAYGNTYVPLFSIYLAFPVGYSLISFFLPVWNIHQTMAAKRDLILRKLDRLGQSINELSRTILDQVETLDPAESEKISKRIEAMRVAYENYKKIPTWPFNIEILAKFSTSQIIPILSLTGLGQPILNALSALLKIVNS
jgi:hypothetical protein